eukprot:scaffold682_cov363-Pavlova_lutheri.AAC.7
MQEGSRPRLLPHRGDALVHPFRRTCGPTDDGCAFGTTRCLQLCPMRNASQDRPRASWSCCPPHPTRQLTHVGGPRDPEGPTPAPQR